MLGTKAGSSAPLAKCDYQYNIRGWLLSINKDYMGSATNQDQYFSLELGYDKSASLGNYAPQYNGNIAGTIWKSAGDGEKRKYDFSYDAVNRLTGADFTQYVSGSGSTAVFDRSAGVDFSVSNLSYDLNGNILTINQMGLKLNSSSPVDQLTYGYYPNTNKLAKVSDGITGASKLGDFVDGTNQWDDYGYDVNGNLVTDLNKGMGTATGVDLTSGGGISYNHLNLPEVITTPKGTITYSYDAAGNKLKKVVAESGQPAKTTLYLGGAVYEDDQLQFIAHEEGRIRTRTPNRLDTLYYDYFIKDHLGNVRMVLTDEQKQDMYPAATMESASASTEEALYSNMGNTRVDKPNGYPYDPYLDPNYKVAKVRGDGQKVGPGILLKVMAGDKFNLRASSWYRLNGATPSVPNTVLQDLVFMLNWGAARVPGSKETQQTLESSGVFQPGAGRFLTEHTDSYIPSRPKAFVNWVLFDEQFRYVGTSSGAEQVGEDGVLTPHVRNDLPVEKNGYLYVYVSNETPNIDVFFDNVQVTHIRGALLEETHYYPFGGTMAGISSRAAGTTENKKKYQQYELNTDFDINLYESFYRSHDPQLGRFWQIDPKPIDFESPYAAMGNNPIRNMDPLGDTIIIRYMSEGKQVESIYQDGSFYKRDGSWLSKDDNGYGSKAYSDLYTLDKLGDKEVSRRIDVLEDSKNLHFIEMPDSGDNNGNSPTSTEDDKNGKPTGSTTKYDPDAKTNARGDKRDPIVGLAHELLGHGYDSDQGKSNYNETKNGIPMYEVSGVNIENRVRAKTGDPKKTTYGGIPIPATLLDDTHKKKKP